MNRFNTETRSLLRRLKKEGFTLAKVMDDEDQEWEDYTTEDRAIDVLTACDVGYLRVTKGEFGSTLYLVYGNGPGELVSDYTFPAWADSEETQAYKDLDRVTEAHFDSWAED